MIVSVGLFSRLSIQLIKILREWLSTYLQRRSEHWRYNLSSLSQGYLEVRELNDIP